jgi:hypothetical protein
VAFSILLATDEFVSRHPDLSHRHGKATRVALRDPHRDTHGLLPTMANLPQLGILRSKTGYFFGEMVFVAIAPHSVPW